MSYRHGFLIATPLHHEEPFVHSVVYVCEHSQQGALGFIINKPFKIPLSELTKNQNIFYHQQSVYLGGPLQSHDRGFVMHRNLGKFWSGTTQLDQDLYLTTTQDILLELGHYPSDLYRICIGYLNWLPGQLEYEFSQNIWLFLPYSQKTLFDTQAELMWIECYHSLGFLPDQIGCVDPGASFVH
ncbi:MAG: YqgE/AlgH family protein [Gammaproteobacteria bacterium]|nr:YqgE/AlgH family protein [Gammaproteobacteria bacterium]